jgi:hypothetical protein
VDLQLKKLRNLGINLNASDKNNKMLIAETHLVPLKNPLPSKAYVKSVPFHKTYRQTKSSIANFTKFLDETTIDNSSSILTPRSNDI